MVKEKQIGRVMNYFEHVCVAAIKLEDNLKVGDKIRFVGGGCEFEQVVRSMQIHNKKVDSAKKGDEIGVQINSKVGKGYRVFKI